MEEIQENEESKLPKIELPELKEKADTAFEEIKKEAVQYIKEHRPSGFGMEYLDDDLNKLRN